MLRGQQVLRCRPAEDCLFLTHSFFFLIHTHPSFIRCWILFSYLFHSWFLFLVVNVLLSLWASSYWFLILPWWKSFYSGSQTFILRVKQNQNIDFASLAIPEIDRLAMKSQVCVFCCLSRGNLRSVAVTCQNWGLQLLLRERLSQGWPCCLPKQVFLGLGVSENLVCLGV